MEGLKYASCEYVGWTHGDLQYNLNSLLKVEELLNEKNNRHDYVLIKGRRKKRKFSDAIFTFLMSVIASIITGKIMYDINAQPNFFSNTLLKEFKNTPKDLMLDIYLYYKILKKKITKLFGFQFHKNKEYLVHRRGIKILFQNF
jgi:hypothetical protein